MREETVSIITPLYNGERFVASTIESVLAQTYPNWEMIIVNDGSKDRSLETVTAYAEKDERIRVYSQPNAGSAAARNNAISHAEGQYIVFLDADDLWDPTFLEEQTAFMKEKNAKLVFGSYRRINEQNEEILKPFIVPEKITYTDLLKTCSMSCLTSMFDVTAFKDYYFREELRSLRDDHAFWLSLLKQIDFAYGNRKVLASYRIFNTSTTAKKRKVIRPQYLVYRKVEKMSAIKSAYYLTCWAINGFKKYRR